MAARWYTPELCEAKADATASDVVPPTTRNPRQQSQNGTVARKKESRGIRRESFVLLGSEASSPVIGRHRAHDMQLQQRRRRLQMSQHSDYGGSTATRQLFSMQTTIDPSSPVISSPQTLSWEEILCEAAKENNPVQLTALNEQEDLNRPRMEIQDLDTYFANNPMTIPRPPDQADVVLRPKAALPLSPKVPAKLSFTPRKTTHGEQSSLFHRACGLRGKVPVFTYTEPMTQHFIAIVEIDGIKMGESKALPSKKQAKEEACEIAHANLDSQLPMVTGEKRRHVAEPSQIVCPSEVLAENWVGILMEYMQSRRLEPPIYSDAAEHSTLGPFHCTVALPGVSDTVFGADARSFGQKAHAKKAAAMEAVLWLRSQGMCAAKKRRVSVPDQESSAARDTPSESVSPVGGNAAQQLHYLIISLSLHTPVYDLVPAGTGWWQVSTRFDPRDVKSYPELAGEVGKLDRVFGKNKAKEQCAQIVVRLLEGLLSRP